MTRRPLRKIDPALDLARYFLSVERLPSPWSTRALFADDRPLEIEVGSGKGLFLVQAASARPDHNFLGTERAEKYARYCAARAAKKRLDNVRVVHGDALRLFAEQLPDECAVAVHVYFPDPWWKKRHKKRRVLNEQFLRDAQRVLRPGGQLHFWTDVEEYFQTTVELIRTTTELAGPFGVAEVTPEHDLDFRTHFERRTRLHGETVYRAEYRKAGR